MISDRPMPGNPWPHDMVITIEDHPTTLLELLWIREAWGLQPVGDDLPPRLATLPVVPGAAVSGTGVPGAAVVHQWQDGWPEVWKAVLESSARVRNADLITRLHASEVGSPERSALLDEVFGPSWSDRFGRDALPEEFSEWNSRVVEASAERMSVPLSEEPERVSLKALIPAWEAGLTRIVVLPCEGDFTRVIGPHALLVTSSTRADPGRYAAALGRFR